MPLEWRPPRTGASSTSAPSCALWPPPSRPTPLENRRKQAPARVRSTHRPRRQHAQCQAPPEAPQPRPGVGSRFRSVTRRPSAIPRPRSEGASNSRSRFRSVEPGPALRSLSEQAPSATRRSLRSHSRPRPVNLLSRAFTKQQRACSTSGTASSRSRSRTSSRTRRCRDGPVRRRHAQGREGPHPGREHPWLDPLRLAFSASTAFSTCMSPFGANAHAAAPRCASCLARESEDSSSDSDDSSAASQAGA